jgi:hypothetical protein
MAQLLALGVISSLARLQTRRLVIFGAGIDVATGEVE